MLKKVKKIKHVLVTFSENGNMIELDRAKY